MCQTYISSLAYTLYGSTNSIVLLDRRTKTWASRSTAMNLFPACLLLVFLVGETRGYTAYNLNRQVRDGVDRLRQEEAVLGLVRRLLGDRAEEIQVNILPYTAGTIPKEGTGDDAADDVIAGRPVNEQDDQDNADQSSKIGESKDFRNEDKTYLNFKSNGNISETRRVDNEVDLDTVSVTTAVNASTKVTTVSVVANTGVAAAWGLHHYLKYWCLAHVSWETSQLALPTPLPQANFTLTAKDRYRYYMNVCTPGYSTVWWQWPHWEKHIDWMALNGINLPLAFNGQETIWRRVWRKFGLTDLDIDDHFAGPAFLPWGRMGNLRKWGGPLSKQWHKTQLKLQHKILARMRSLGMIPVLPAFGGQVPDAIVTQNPNSTFTKQNWLNFGFNYSGVYLLDPADPLFQDIGSTFIREQATEYGTNHVYNCDTFNEMRPSSNSSSYIAAVGKAVFSAISTADRFAVWVMQGWLFLDQQFWGDDQVEALLTSVPQGKLLLLDLDSTYREQYTRTRSYHGQPFIFNMLHTYGGQLAMFGRVDHVNQRPFQARSMANSSMVGTGFTMEGIHNSYVMYDLMGEMAWRDEPVADLEEWFSEYSTRRYGGRNENASQASRIFSRNVYNSSIRNFHGKVLLIRPPALGLKNIRWYNVSDLLEAWDLFIGAADELGHQPTFQFDLVDLTRQVLANAAPVWYSRASRAYRTKDIPGIHENGLMFLDLLKDMERILATNTNFMLGPWLEDAKSLATNKEEEAQYEFNARNQITLWGPDGQILDYAGKQWSGLMKDYYLPRWNMFFKSLEKAVLTKTKFNKNKFRKMFLTQLGKPFGLETKLYPTEPVGNTVQVAKQLYKKWRIKLK